LLAIASSYMLEEGEKESPPRDTIFIRHVTDMETKPK
jgi:cell cycle arrest protein BUB3